MSKFVSVIAQDWIRIGKIYSDGSSVELIELTTNGQNKLQIDFMQGSDIAYGFLSECTELFDILAKGICGVTMADIADRLCAYGYERR